MTLLLLFDDRRDIAMRTWPADPSCYSCVMKREEAPRPAFVTPAVGTYGNVGPFSVVGPGFWDWSEAVSRQFQVREGQKIEFRAEAFNVTNSLRRGNPGTTLSSTNTFGVITSSTVGPRIMQFALKYTF